VVNRLYHILDILLEVHVMIASDIEVEPLMIVSWFHHPILRALSVVTLFKVSLLDVCRLVKQHNLICDSKDFFDLDFFDLDFTVLVQTQFFIGLIVGNMLRRSLIEALKMNNWLLELNEASHVVHEDLNLCYFFKQIRVKFSQASFLILNLVELCFHPY